MQPWGVPLLLRLSQGPADPPEASAASATVHAPLAACTGPYRPRTGPIQPPYIPRTAARPARRPP